MVDARDFRDKTAIVGVGTTDFRALYRDLDPERSAYDLGIQAFKAALDDAGLKKEDIDGLLVSRIPSYGRTATMLGLPNLKNVNVTEGGGRQSGLTLQIAANWVYSGLANYVACMYGNNGRSVGATYGGGEAEGAGSYGGFFGMTSPGAELAMMWRRYQHKYGVGKEALAAITIAHRKHAAFNPNAVMYGRPLSLEDYMNARFIAEPLCLYDYCLINDGGVCFIVTSAERAKALKKPPVYISGTATCSALDNFYAQEDLFEAPLASIASRLYPAAGVTRKDIDFAEIYDNFTPTVAFGLEGYGFAPKGEVTGWVQGGRIELGGELPIGTSGAHTSESYMQGWALHVETVRQLRGECGERQVKGAEIGQYICTAPISVSHIFRR